MTDVVEITLTQGKIALIDPDDMGLIAACTWYAHCSKSKVSARERWYARTTKPGTHNTQIMMHRLILGLDDPSVIVDHANGNGLDNRRSNLRLASRRENSANAKKYVASSSQYKGVTSSISKSSPWQARIISGHLGMFAEEVDAALAYDFAAIREFGQFAVTNFPKRILELLEDRCVKDGLLKRLEAAELVLNLMVGRGNPDINEALEAWKRARGHDAT